MQVDRIYISDDNKGVEKLIENELIMANIQCSPGFKTDSR